MKLYPFLLPSYFRPLSGSVSTTTSDHDRAVLALCGLTLCVMVCVSIETVDVQVDLLDLCSQCVARRDENERKRRSQWNS